MINPDYPVAYRVGDLIEITPGSLGGVDNLQYVQRLFADGNGIKITYESQFKCMGFSLDRRLVHVNLVGVDNYVISRMLGPIIYAERFRPVSVEVVVTRRLTVLPVLPRE